MEILALFAFLAGLVTVLSPCVLPLLPVLLGAGAGGGKLRPLATILGFILSFTLLTLFLGALVTALGLDPDILRTVAAVVILLMALVLVVPALKDRFMQWTSAALNRRTSAATPWKRKDQAQGSGLVPGLLSGFSLGVVWTPCVGPIMASVITLAVTQTVDLGAVVITLAYTVGTAVPLFAIMQGGKALLARFPGFQARLGAIQRVFGILMILTGLSLLTGLDRQFQSWVLDTFPGYGSGLTAIEETEAVQKALAEREGSPDAPDPEGTDIDREGTDPLARTSGEWFNSPPLTLEGLKGKVVLVDFWTYSCVNCLRTLPQLRALHETYADEGLVVVGVHTPEFAFERKAANVQAAMMRLGVTWPVVQDNDYGIWHAFSNRYWPAHWLFDREGRLVYRHVGEGGREETEKAVRTALGLDGEAMPDTTADGVPAELGKASADTNPETYLGSQRGGPAKVQSTDADLSTFGWAVSGPWTQADEYMEAGPAGNEPSSLALDIRARGVHVVLSRAEGGPAPGTANIAVELDGRRLGTVTMEGEDLHTLAVFDRLTEGRLVLRVPAGIRLHAFTFN